MVVETDLSRVPTDFMFAVAGHRHEQRRRIAQLGPQAVGHFVAVHAGQSDVEKHDFGPVLFDREQRFRAVDGSADFVPEFAQQCDRDVQQRGLIFDHQDPAWMNQRARAGGGWDRAFGRSLACSRQADDEFRSTPHPFARRPDAPAVKLGQAPDDGQPNPQASLRAMKRSVGLRKQVENIG